MHFGDFDIPSELLRAQEASKLVIFAGAGVSCAAKIPDFEGLVGMIERHFRATSGSGRLDQRLGELKRMNYNVHRFVLQELLKFEEPAEVHSLLLRLFRKEQEPKVITTNFDILFNQAVKRLGMKEPEYHFAPALPPGDRFDGIIQLHGSVKGKPENLVLTDEDFGRAYLTEGWARRFLIRLFESHTVMFYGYSHDDTMMHYLALALPPSTQRFALCTESDAGNWTKRGIVPVIGEGANPENIHSLAEKCLEKWGEWTQASFSWVEERIRSIVKVPDNPDSSDRDLLIQSLRSSSTSQFFVRHAKDPFWVKWADNNGFIQPLFDPECKLSDVEQQLALWVSKSFVNQYHGEVLELIARNDQRLNRYFWQSVVWQVTHGESRPRGQQLAAWIAILIQSAPFETKSHRGEGLDHLMSKCEWPRDSYALLQLLSYLLSPVATAQRSAAFIFDKSEYQFEYAVDLRGEHYWLSEKWSQLRPHTADIWRVLLPTVQKYLTDSFTMNVAFDKAGGDGDVQSFWRAAIEPHEQDEDNHRAFDVLIDVARDILEYLLATPTLIEEGSRTIESWFATEVPLLRRIAIHGVGLNSAWSADAKINWLLGKNLLSRIAFKHEVFQVIRKALPDCTESTVKRLVDEALKYNLELQDGVDKAKIIASGKFNLLDWMATARPGTPLIDQAVQSVLAQYPDFKRREYPDLDHWSSGTQLVVPKSPKTVEELLEMPIVECALFLSDFKPREPNDWDDTHRGLLDTLQLAVGRDFDWSLKLAAQLVDQNRYGSDVWYNLIKGWEKKPLSNEEWQLVIPFLKTNPQIHRTTGGACELLEQTIMKSADIPVELLTALEELSDLIWPEIDRPTEEGLYDYDWLTTAINHSSGHLTEFWIRSLDYRRRVLKESGGLSLDYLTRFNKLVQGDSFAAGLGRSVLASRLHYLAWIDADWVIGYLLPAFDFERDQSRALQAWHGYLHWGRVTTSIREQFKPLLLQAIEHVGETQSKMREKLFDLITDTILIDPGSPPDMEWLFAVMKGPGTADVDLIKIVERIRDTLREADEDFRKSLWVRWLKEFWRNRLANIPVKLVDLEAKALIEWCAYLQPVFGEAVSLALETQVKEFKQTFLFHELTQRGILDTHPMDACRLVVHLLRAQSDYRHHAYDLVPLYEKLELALNVSEIADLKEQLVRLGIKSATD